MSKSPLRGLAPPPPGVTPNFVNPDNRNPENIALHSILLTFSTIALLIRLYTRYFITRQPGLDDYLCIVGFAAVCTYSALLLSAMSARFIGYHIWEVTYPEFVKGARLEFCAQLVYVVASAFIKFSCLVFYRRFLARVRKYKYICYGGMLFVVCGYVAVFFLLVFSCKPIGRRFNASIPGKCLSSNITGYLPGSLNLVTDIFVVVLPLPIIWKLNMKLSHKLRLMAVFGLGFVVVALCLTRLIMTYFTFLNPDATWVLSDFDVYPTIELNIGLMCACSLAFPAFIERYSPLWKSSFRSFTSTIRRRSRRDTSSDEEKSSSSSTTNKWHMRNTTTQHSNLKQQSKTTTEVHDRFDDDTERQSSSSTARLEHQESTSTLRMDEQDGPTKIV